MPATTATIFKVLDVRNTYCPLPVIRAQKTIQEVPVGEILEILATDEGSEHDIPAWTSNTGHELLKAVREGSVFRFLIRRVH